MPTSPSSGEIAPLRSDRLPSVVYVLGVASTRERHPQRWELETERLADWYLGQWRVKAGALTCEQLWTGRRAGQLWESLQAILPERRSAWLFSGSLGRDLTLTDFWGQLHGAPDHGRAGPSRAGANRDNVSAGLAVSGRVDVPRVRRRARHHDRHQTWTTSLVIDDDRCTAVACASPAGRELILADTRNYWLPELTETSAIGRLRECQQHTEELLGLVRGCRLGPLRLTGAAQAWASWRRRPVADMVQCHDVPEVRELEARAYFGGRCQCFRHGCITEPTWVLDVQWSYPSIMASERLPLRLVDHGDEHSSPLDILQTSHRGYVADVLIESDTQVYPLRDTEGVHYVTGRYWTSLAGRELDMAVRAGHVRRVGQWAEYELGWPLSAWAEWLRRTWADRAAGHTDRQRAMLKHMGRSLYGRFARRLPQWEECECSDRLRDWGVWPEVNADTGAVRVLRGMGDRVCRLVSREPAEDTLIAISAFIAAAARTRLQALIDLAGLGCVYYVDTDSVHVSRDGRHRLIEAGEVQPGVMGCLAEKEYTSDAEYCGCRHYRLGSQWTVAGLHLTRSQVGPNRYVVRDQQRLRGILAEGPHGTVAHETRWLSRPQNQYGGITWENGTVTPHRVGRPAAQTAAPI